MVLRKQELVLDLEIKPFKLIQIQFYNKYMNLNNLILEYTQSDKPKHIWSYLERLSQLKYISIRLH